MGEALIQLEWEQNNSELIIKLLQVGKIFYFTIDKRLINFLVSNSPKIVSLFVEFQNLKEEEYLVDFEGIKPLPSINRKLKIKISEKDPTIDVNMNLSILGKYCIARGESHYERYLDEKGWQNHRKYFDIYGSSYLKNKTAVSEEQVKKTENKTENKNSLDFYRTLFE
jgi:hypothetical protein